MDITNDQMGVSINGDPQNGLFIREKKMDDLEVPPFQETPKWTFNPRCNRSAHWFFSRSTFDRTSRRPSKAFFWWAWNPGTQFTLQLSDSNCWVSLALDILTSRYIYIYIIYPISSLRQSIMAWKSWKSPTGRSWGSDLEQVFLSIFNGKTFGAWCLPRHRRRLRMMLMVWCRL